MNPERTPRALRVGRRRRRVVSLLLAAVVVVCGLGYYHYGLKRPTMGSGPAGPAVAAAPFARVWSERPVFLLGLGDSVTKGFGASPGRSYFECLLDNRPDELPDMVGLTLSSVYPNLDSRNLAVSGSNSFQCLELQLPSVEPFPEDTLGIVVLTTGGNDLIHWYGRKPPEEGAMYGATRDQALPWVEAFEGRLEAIVEQIGGLFPGGCHVFLANIYDPSDGEGNPRIVGLPPWPDMLDILAQYNAVIARIAESHDHVHLVDMRAVFLGHGFYCRQPWRAHYHRDDPHLWYAYNIEDPNDSGYDALRRVFLNAMVRALAPTDGAP